MESFIGGCGIFLVFGCAFWVSRKEPRSEFQWAMSFGECRRNADSEVYLHWWSVLVKIKVGHMDTDITRKECEIFRLPEVMREINKGQ